MVHSSTKRGRWIRGLTLAALALSVGSVSAQESETFQPYSFDFGGDEAELWNDTFTMCAVHEGMLLSSLQQLQDSRNTKRRWYGGIGLALSTASAVLSAVNKNPEWAIGFSVLAGAASVPSFVTSGDQEARQALSAQLSPIRERRAAVLQATTTLSRAYADLDARCRAAAVEGATKTSLETVGCEEVPAAGGGNDSEEALRHVVEATHRYNTAWGDVEAGLFAMREVCMVR